MDSPNPIIYMPGMRWKDVKGTAYQLTRALARYREVLWLDPPTSLVKLARERDLGEALIRPRIHHTSEGIIVLENLSMPGPRNPVSNRISEALISLSARKYLRRRGLTPSATIGTSPMRSLEVTSTSRKLYFATDDFGAGAELMGLSKQAVMEHQKLRLEESDAVLAISPTVAALLEAEGYKANVLSNGCDESLYDRVMAAPRHPDVRLPSPIVGVVGQFNDRTDYGLLAAIADRGVSLLLVGPASTTHRRALQDIAIHSNVQWLGRRPLEELPAIFKCMTVGLTPYKDSDFNNASSPLKTLEYISAGLPAVTTSTRTELSLPENLVKVGQSAPDVLSLLLQQLTSPQSSTLTQARRAFVEANSWDRRAAELLQIAEGDI